ncbi:MAG: hypothetical protein AAGE96_05425 [Cyanobacteria bacterium P01_G01_bin.19]
MTYHDRERLWSLIISAIDNLERVSRSRELTNILWDINNRNIKTEQDWHRIEILLESYENSRDEFLDAALSNLKELVLIMKGQA